MVPMAALELGDEGFESLPVAAEWQSRRSHFQEIMSSNPDFLPMSQNKKIGNSLLRQRTNGWRFGDVTKVGSFLNVLQNEDFYIMASC